MVVLKTQVLLVAVISFAQAEEWDKECPLDSRSIYPYVVKIWYKPLKMTFGHGSIISYFAVLSACTNFMDPQYDPSRHRNDYEIIGNKVLEAEPIQKVCRQTVGVQTYMRHPKCLEPTQHIFNFALFILKDPFNVAGSISYPTLPIRNDPYILTQDILSLDSTLRQISHCEMPLFYFKDKRTPMTFNTGWQVEPIPFKEKCEKLFCQYEPTDSDLTATCRVRYGLRTTATRLCMKAGKKTLIDGEVEYARIKVNWYAGGPLICNGTAYGLITQVKWRHGFPGANTDRTDFFYVTTFLRAYGWIVQNKIRYGANWIHPFFVHLEAKDKATLTTPSRPPKPKATLFPPRKQRILQLINSQAFDRDRNEKSRSVGFYNEDRHPPSSADRSEGPELFIQLGCFTFTAFYRRLIHRYFHE